MQKVLFILLAFVFTPSLQAEDDVDLLSGLEAYEKSDYELALKHFMISAENGNELSQNNLGWMYYHGQGTAKDYVKSFYWYKKAESSGEPLVLYMLGQSYLFGRGTDKNHTKAFEYYHKAYGKGLSVADLRVGLDCYFGISAEKNTKKAKELIFSSAKSGHPAAQFFAGYLELKMKNKDKAIYWLKAAEKNNYHLAKFLLAEISQSEEGYLGAANEIVSAMPMLAPLNVSIEVE